MTMLLTQFGALTLPTAAVRVDTGPAMRSEQIELIGGGVFDAQGAARARLASRRITQIAIMSAASSAAFATAMRTLLAQAGVRATLTGQYPDGGTVTILARLVAVGCPRDYSQLRHIPVHLTFELAAEAWSGTARDVTQALDVVPRSYTLLNDGNAPVRSIIITVVAATSNITRVDIVRTGVSAIRWDGMLGVGASLVIDCGTRTVTVSGGEAYGGLSLLAGHASADWLRLDPGNNTVTIARTGGGVTSTGRFQYSDGWY